MKFGINVAFEKIFDTWLLSAIVNVKGMKTTLKVEPPEHILSDISEIPEDTIFVHIDKISTYHFAKKKTKQYI